MYYYYKQFMNLTMLKKYISDLSVALLQYIVLGYFQTWHAKDVLRLPEASSMLAKNFSSYNPNTPERC